MVRALLRDRFGLKTSLETRDQTVYVMRAVRPDKPIGPGEGTFDAQLSWRPDAASAVPGDPTDGRASLFTAVQEQLGVRLTPERRPVEVLVIESLSRPTPD